MLTEAFLDSRLVALPQLIRDATKPNPTAEDVRRFVSALLDAGGDVFQGALLFRSRGKGSFVLIHERGGPFTTPRTWLRWPMRRLFATRRGCIITNPVSGVRALAIPFDTGEDRDVVLARIRTGDVDSAETTFLRTLESISTAMPQESVRGEAPARFLWFGTNSPLATRVQAVVSERGWELQNASSFGNALMLLEGDAVDVVLLDARALPDPAAALRALRHAARIGDAPVLYFSDEAAEPEIEALVDECLLASASACDLVKALKKVSTFITGTRTEALRKAVGRFDEHLRNAGDYSTLARSCADAAASVGCDVVSVMLVDDGGAIYAAQLPTAGETLIEHLPTTFVTGEAILQSQIDDRFFEEVFDERSHARRVRGLEPVSGAAFPIRDGIRVVGTLLALSRERRMFEPEFTALEDVAQAAGAAFSLLQAGTVRSTPGANGKSDPWRQIFISNSRIDAYEGHKSRSLLRVAACDGRIAAIAVVDDEDRAAAANLADAALQATLAAVYLENGQPDMPAVLARFDNGLHGILLGIVDQENWLTYACNGFPVPLRVPSSGPVASLSHARAKSAGTIELGADCVTLIYSNDFQGQIDSAELVSAVQGGLRRGAGNPAQNLPDLAVSRGRLTFASITMRSSGAAAQRPQTLS